MSVWQTIYGDTAEALVKEFKSQLLIEIIEKVRGKNLKQREVAEILKVSQPRVSDLMKAKLYKFSIESLLTYNFELEVKK